LERLKQKLISVRNAGTFLKNYLAGNTCCFSEEKKSVLKGTFHSAAKTCSTEMMVL